MSEDRAEYVEESLKKLKKESNNDVVSASAVSKYCEIPKSFYATLWAFILTKSRATKLFLQMTEEGEKNLLNLR